MQPSDYLHSANVLAFLRAIRLGEGTSTDWGYRTIVGGELFDDMSDHPRKRVWIERYKVWSTAAGAYQFIAPTWDEMAAKYKLPDFSPHSQDLAAIGLIIRRGAIDDVVAGRIEEAIKKCRLEWASLPGSPYGQRTESLQRVLDEYVAYGGRLGAQAQEQPPAPIERKDTMSPLIPILFSAAAEVLPDLVRLRSGSKQGEVNARTMELALGAIKEATGAVNEQEAVDAIRKDETARAQAEAAVRARYYDMLSSNEASVKEAREFNRTWRDGQPFLSFGWLNVLFVEFLSLVLIAVGMYGGFKVLDMEGISNELKGAVITLMLIGSVTAVVAFWLGSSRSSQRKDERVGTQ